MGTIRSQIAPACFLAPPSQTLPEKNALPTETPLDLPTIWPRISQKRPPSNDFFRCNPPGALGLYCPYSNTNQFSVIGANSQTGTVLHQDDRRLQIDLRDVSRRIPNMSLSGFRGIHLGLMNPTRLPENQYEAMRSEYYLLYGTPREIFENAQRIHPF